MAEAGGLALVEDDGLLAENAGLTEWPVPLLGRFDPAFLEVPREVIQLTMRTNQKYFACVDREGALAPNFVCTANIEASDGGAAIVAGNERVLSARLSDAKFFWEQDLKVPLEDQSRKLGGIVFHEKLGTVADKVLRVEKLAQWLVKERIVTGADRAQVQAAARLAKADLVTQSVGEFPELQGTLGAYLARAQGQPDCRGGRDPRPLQAGRAGRRRAHRLRSRSPSTSPTGSIPWSPSSRSARSRPARATRSRFAARPLASSRS